MLHAFVQARMSSSRLPGKVLLPILNVPMLELQLERIFRSMFIDRVIILTSTDASDDILCEFCERKGVEYFRGDLNDVLDRYYQSSQKFKSNDIMRITADCPLIDPGVIDYVYKQYRQSGVDYASNTIKPTYPDGMDVEVFNREALEYAWLNATLPSEREHVTAYIYKHPEAFKLLNVESVEDNSEYRITVDEDSDYKVASLIYEALYPGNSEFTLDDILDYLRKNTEILEINQKLVRNEGLKISMQKDSAHR